VDDHTDTDERRFDLGALLIGGWFVAVGLLGMFAGADSTSDALPLLFPLTLVLVGIGLLLPPRRRTTGASTDEDRPPEIPDEYFA
jgi:hypothetical protein